MTPEEQLFGLLAAAQEQQQTVKDAIGAITSQIVTLQNTSASLQNAVSKAAADGVKGSIGDAQKTAVNGLNASATTLQDAAAAATAAASWLGFKVAALIAFTAVAMVAALFLGAQTLLPTVDERAEKLALQTTIAELKQRGGKAVLASCDGRPCIEVDSKAPTYVSASGHTLAILRGY